MKRGARGLPISRDLKDQWRFVKLLYHMNDEFKSDVWEREVRDLGLFERPPSWPSRKPLVKILAWVLMPNHTHLLLREIKEGGITKFSRKIFDSMSRHFNEKYAEKGSLFQGPYRARTISEDSHFRHLCVYIMVKNVFELYPNGGLKKAVEQFDEAWEWAVHRYPFSSLADYATTRTSPIIDKDLLGELFSSPAEFRAHAEQSLREGEMDDEKMEL